MDARTSETSIGIGKSLSSHGRAGLRAIPIDSRERGLERFASPWIDAGDPRDETLDVGTKVRAAFAILGRGAQAYTVVQDGFHLVVAIPRHRGMVVHDEASDGLPAAAPHDARLSVVHGEALVDSDRGDERGEPARACGDALVARKDEIVGVTRIARAHGLGGGREAYVEAI